MIESFQKNRRGIFIMAISAICVCVGQLLWKLSTQYGILPLILGFFFYGIGACLMLLAYRYGSLSVLQPMLSLNYVLSMILAAWILHEEITLYKCVGVVAMIIGVVLIAGGDEN
jgi:undecaprenyl phosphate-alpha-L-ara4N flippase subunit ArnE